MLNTTETDYSFMNFSNILSQNSFRRNNDIQPWMSQKYKKENNKARFIQSSRKDQINNFLNKQLYQSQSSKTKEFSFEAKKINKFQEKIFEKTNNIVKTVKNQEKLKIIYFPQNKIEENPHKNKIGFKIDTMIMQINGNKSWQKGNFLSKDARKFMTLKGFSYKNACSVRGTSGKLHNNQYRVNQNINKHSYTVI